MVLIDGLYINNSGGLMLLKYLVEEAEKSLETQVFYLLDQRAKEHFTYLDADKCLFLKASLSTRKKFYKEEGVKFNVIFCFGNLPPSVRLKATVFVYVHNLLFLDIPKGYPFWQTITKKAKTLIFSSLLKNADVFMLQTAFGKKLFTEKYGYSDSQVLLMPFFDPARKAVKSDTQHIDHYVFVSDGNPHKNHVNLLKAWELIHLKGYHFTLHLTVSNHYPKLVKEIERFQQKGVKIINHGLTPALDLYSKCGFLIYPSLLESFGLGLIEASLSGMQVIAADLPYTHAVVKPSGIFDPFSPDSIAYAIIKARPGASNFSPTELIVENKMGALLTMLKHANAIKM
jgi:glycosyltransferase involved in cell wall biosynthesis